MYQWASPDRQLTELSWNRIDYRTENGTHLVCDTVLVIHCIAKICACSHNPGSLNHQLNKMKIVGNSCSCDLPIRFGFESLLLYLMSILLTAIMSMHGKMLVALKCTPLDELCYWTFLGIMRWPLWIVFWVFLIQYAHNCNNGWNGQKEKGNVQKCRV